MRENDPQHWCIVVSGPPTPLDRLLRNCPVSGPVSFAMAFSRSAATKVFDHFDSSDHAPPPPQYLCQSDYLYLCVCLNASVYHQPVYHPAWNIDEPMTLGKIYYISSCRGRQESSLCDSVWRNTECTSRRTFSTHLYVYLNRTDHSAVRRRNDIYYIIIRVCGHLSAMSVHSRQPEKLSILASQPDSKSKYPWRVLGISKIGGRNRKGFSFRMQYTRRARDG